MPYTCGSIQFILYSPFSQIKNVPQSALQSVHIDISVQELHIGSGKTPKTTLHREKMEETFRRATEEDPSPQWTGAIDAMCTEGQIRVKTHSMNMREYE